MYADAQTQATHGLKYAQKNCESLLACELTHVDKALCGQCKPHQRAHAKETMKKRRG